MLEYIAYCLECQKELDKCPNGNLIHFKAKRHHEATGHEVIVGYKVSKED